MKPTRRFLQLLAAWSALGLVAVLWPPAVTAWWGSGIVLAAVAVLDARRASRRPRLVIRREAPKALALGRWADVTLKIDGPGETELIELYDIVWTDAETEGLPASCQLPSDGFAEIGYRLRALGRGDRAIQPTEVFRPSPWGFFKRREYSGETTEVKVLPDFRTVSRYALLTMDTNAARLGIRMQRRRGEGLEFQELRDYRESDTLRQVDWPATVRRNRMISREYREETDQQIVLLLDCGRKMHSRDGELSHFDFVLNSLLLLTYVAAGQGDSVGLLTFAGEHRWLAPQSGSLALSTMVRSIYDLQTSEVAPDYLDACRRLLARQRRRALVILVTNLRDEDSEELVSALGLLRRRHVPLIASLKETELEKTGQRVVRSFDEALTVASTHHYLAARERSHLELSARGGLVIDAMPSELASRLVEQYLDVKRSGLL